MSSDFGALFSEPRGPPRKELPAKLTQKQASMASKEQLAAIKQQFFLLATDIGLRPARAMGLSEDRGRQWANRDGMIVFVDNRPLFRAVMFGSIARRAKSVKYTALDGYSL